MKKIEILVNTFSWMFLKANKVKSDKAYYGKDNTCTEGFSLKLPQNILMNFLILLASRAYIDLLDNDPYV